MASVNEQVRSAASTICQNIERYDGDREFLSQNLLAQLRNLVEGLIVWAQQGDSAVEFHYDRVGPAIEHIKATAKFRLLSRFHGLLQASASHYTLDGDPSERLMLKYYEYLIRTRDLARTEFGIAILHSVRVQSSHAEYRNLMQYLTSTHSNLLDLVDMTDAAYAQLRSWATSNSRRTPTIFPALDEARRLIRANRAGSRILRYLMLQMRNQLIKAQYDYDANRWLSGLHLTSRSSPFDTMPFCTSPAGHNPRFADLAESLDATGREHELLARRLRTNVEQHGSIYTPAVDCEDLGDVDKLIAKHNRLLPNTRRHAPRKLAHANGHLFIVGYEDDTVAIIERLQSIAGAGVAGHAAAVEEWLDDNPLEVDDDLKADALKGLFSRSKVAFVYGPAGTGKSTMVDHIANFFADERKLFLAHTNPAVDNLKRRVDAPNSFFSTIASHVRNSSPLSARYKVVVIDECSFVDNASLLKVLESTTFDLLVLVGDVYQIESIQFGNWFSLARSYVPEDSVFELTKPWRTDDESLLTLWDRVRNLDDRIEESLSKSSYSKQLGDALFRRESDDEIILCLNYDGLYGINNVNRFLQASNPNAAVAWGEATFKVGDPVLFTETERFRPVIFNNLKGVIAAIERAPGRITFDVTLESEVNREDVRFADLRWVEGSTVQFDVFERPGSDEDDDEVNTLVPFQLAYAVSIHKAQGLEYESVKVVITDANEERISHSIFYTAITRARRQLDVFWTAETQQRILSRLAVRENVKDESLLKARRGVVPVNVRPRRTKERWRP